VGTLSGGLNLFDRATEIFHHCLPDSTDPNSLSHWRISTLTEDEHGAIWIGTHGGGVNKLILSTSSPSTGSGQALSKAEGLAGAVYTRFQHEPGESNRLGSNFVVNVIADKNNVVWVATERELDQILPAVERNGHLVRRFGGDLPHAGWKKWFEKTNLAFALGKGQSGNVWIGNNLGFVCWNATANTYTFNVIYEDRSGVLWFGSNGNGLFKYDPKAAPFSRRQTPSAKLSLWRGASIRSLCETRDGTMWLGAARGELLQLNRRTGECARVYFFASKNRCVDFVFAMLEDPRGALWLGSEEGLHKMERRNGKFQLTANYEPEPDDSLSAADGVYKIFINPAKPNEIWFATNTQFI